MNETIKLIENNAAVDAAILTKARALDGVARYFGCSLEEMAMIGDEITDLSILTRSGLGLAGAPSNAQERVKDTVRGLRNGFVSQGEVFDGFLDFYREAERLGIRLVISDKDGVLKDGSNLYGERFREQVALNMGRNGKPYVVVLTGSSYEQNVQFIEQYFPSLRLGANPMVVDYPWLLLAESGAVHINVLNGTRRNYVRDICPDLLRRLKGEFEAGVRQRLDAEVLPEFGFGWSSNSEDQRAKVYHASEKLSMVTFNVPREFSDGKPYRKSEEAKKYRSKVMRIMEQEAISLELPYEIL
jgi:3-deoxy-D-manno-octulosonate 8-phosphate phosphatase KdsC-like HAD superfamily phosphatase